MCFACFALQTSLLAGETVFVQLGAVLLPLFVMHFPILSSYYFPSILPELDRGGPVPGCKCHITLHIWEKPSLGRDAP